MRNLLNPKWILIINTLPILVLFLLFFGEFQIIKTLLDKVSVFYWKSFGFALLVLWILNLLYVVYLIVKKKNVSVYYGINALLCYIPFIYLFGFHSDKILPFSIPQWMVPGNMILYVGAFLMPTLVYSLFVLVIHFTPETKELKSWHNFLVAILIPILFYLVTQIPAKLIWISFDADYMFHVFLIFIIAVTLVFLFFLIRGFFILTINRTVQWKKYQLFWKVPVTFILPLIGLLLNNGRLSRYLDISNSGIFGDFDSLWFYLLAALNGIILCLPNMGNTVYRLILFIARSITFAFTLYFFLVFLPFLPISIIAIIAVGTGFLMLTPLLLFVIHVNELSQDYLYLKFGFPKSIRILSVAAFLVIPVCVTVNYLIDRSNLRQALEYLYSPDYSKEYDIDESSLKRTMGVIKKQKDNNYYGLFGTSQPYLSSYYNWLVLDNLTLSDVKMNYIESVFFGWPPYVLRSNAIQDNKVEITNISSSSSYDPSQKAWRSWIDLEISNMSNDDRFSEYATSFELPAGTWISDYYLYVGKTKEMGILAEKKSAMWVFSNIRNENRDPGILYYLTGNRVALRVFPFAKDEVRKTGIELLHKEPVRLTIDGKTVQLGDSSYTEEKTFENADAVYVSASEKQNLKKVIRKPYFHFVVDATDKSKIAEYSRRIEAITKNNPLLSDEAKVSFVNAYVSTSSLSDNWKQEFEKQSFQGGFFAERAIKSILFHSYKEQKAVFPIIVLVTDNLQKAVFNNDFPDWSFCFPESDLFYELTNKGKLQARSLTSKPYIIMDYSADLHFEYPVLEYKLEGKSVRYLRDNNQPDIILKNEYPETNINGIIEKDWNTALTIQAQRYSQLLHPETSDRAWINLVKSSFQSKVMTPVTSYIVVENEAQKAILKKKQEHVLNSNKSLDPGEDTQRMSEPALIMLAALLIILLWYREKRLKLRSS